MPCFTLIISSLPAWSLLLLLVIDGVLLTVWALPSRPQSVIAAKRLAPSVRSACLQQDSLGIAIGSMTYLGREKMTKIGVTLSIGGLKCWRTHKTMKLPLGVLYCKLYTLLASKLVNCMSVILKIVAFMLAI